jgi:hypothetical protein
MPRIPSGTTVPKLTRKGTFERLMLKAADTRNKEILSPGEDKVPTYRRPLLLSYGVKAIVR